MHTVAKVEKQGQYPVVWLQRNSGSQIVMYGNEVRHFGKDQDVQAAEEFGHCVLHQASCAGDLKCDEP